jgi:universal stress protein E
VLLVRLPRHYQHPTILTAMDPSHAVAKPPQLDEDILHLGGLLSNALHGKLHAVHAYVPQSISSLAGDTAAGLPVAETCASDARRHFDRLLEGADILPLSRHLIGGSPSDGIARLARRMRADIVVAGSVSRAGLQCLLIGNSSKRLLNSLHCDLLVARPAESCNRVPTESHGPRIVTVLPAC